MSLVFNTFQLSIALNSQVTLTLKYIAFDILKIVLLLISIAYYTLAERKIMAAAQRRKGPNIVGIFGLLQPLADGLKLLTKELLIPSTSNSNIFLFAPLLILVLSLVSWIVIPFGITTIEGLENKTISDVSVFTNNIATLLFIKLDPIFYYPFSSVANINYGILFILAISSLNVYGIIIAGWSSNSKYAFLGSLRSAAQMISYEVSIGLVILPIILIAGTLNFTKIVVAQMYTIWFVAPLLPCAIIFFISMLAETNRTPFDLTEAEAELVAGYNTEYSSIIFAMFFLAEYSNMILMSSLFVCLFFGGWLAPLSLLWPSVIFSCKTVIICFLFVIVRASFPRYRYDQLMSIGWKIFLPISLSYLFFAAGLLLTFDAFYITSEVLY
jgi:NADH-quinone oxidoreductase subunit H